MSLKTQWPTSQPWNLHQRWRAGKNPHFHTSHSHVATSCAWWSVARTHNCSKSSGHTANEKHCWVSRKWSIKRKKQDTEEEPRLIREQEIFPWWISAVCQNMLSNTLTPLHRARGATSQHKDKWGTVKSSGHDNSHKRTRCCFARHWVRVKCASKNKVGHDGQQITPTLSPPRT